MRPFKPGDRVRYVGRYKQQPPEIEARAAKAGDGVQVGALGTVHASARFQLLSPEFVVVSFDEFQPKNKTGLWQCPPESLRHVYDGDEASSWDAKGTVWVPAALRA